MNNFEKGNELESFIHYVYWTLLENSNDKNVKVYQKKKMQGQSGATHEFDIFYEFEYLNVLHQVAIECKNHKKPVSKKEITDFVYKINDIKNVIGIMVSRNGYQEGNKIVANHEKIQLLTTKDLPNFYQIVNIRLEALLPDENTKGDPLWVFMEMDDNGNNTGNYLADEEVVFVFFSKGHAEKFSPYVSGRFQIRGLTRHHLKVLCNILNGFNQKVGVVTYPVVEGDGVHITKVSPQEIIADFT